MTILIQQSLTRTVGESGQDAGWILQIQSYRFVATDRNRRSTPSCVFRIRCNFNEKQGVATVSSLHDVHTCKAASPNANAEARAVSRAETSKLKFLLEAIPQLITVESDTPTKAIIDAVRTKYGQELSLRQAQKVKASLCPRPHEPSPRASGSLRHHDVQSSNDGSQQGQASSPTRHGQITNEDSRMQLDTEEPPMTGHEPIHNSRQQNADHVPKTPLIPLPLQSTHAHRSPGTIQPILSPYGAREPGYRHNGPTYESHNNERTPQEVRAEAAALFQRASEKFQEATSLHAEATRLFASVANA